MVLVNHQSAAASSGDRGIIMGRIITDIIIWLIAFWLFIFIFSIKFLIMIRANKKSCRVRQLVPIPVEALVLSCREIKSGHSHHHPHNHIHRFAVGNFALHRSIHYIHFTKKVKLKFSDDP
jgi:hypothetical protein